VSASGKPGQGPKKPVQTDARSDIYSFGATIYHLLTNMEPDPVHTPQEGSIIAKNPVLHVIVIQGKQICPIEQVIIKAMQLNATDRYQTAKEMKMALHQCLVSTSQTQISHILQDTRNICPQCGYRNRYGAKFCKVDGQPLSASVTQKQTTIRQAKPTIHSKAVQVSSLTKSERYYQQGIRLLHAKRYNEAIRMLQQAAQSGMPTEKAYEITYTLARAYRQAGIAWKAGNSTRFIEYTKLAISQFQLATRYKPAFSAPWLQMGMCQRDIRQFQDAAYALQQAIKLSPQNIVNVYQLGKVYQEQGNTKQAEQIFLEVLRRDPHHVHTLLALGRLYLSTNQVTLAIPVLQQAILQATALGETWFVLGQAYIQINKWQEALESLQKAFQYSKGNTSTISGALALCYIRLNRKDEARGILGNAAQRDPGNKDLIRLQRLL
jgi:tetratricopeptide (TPR) repeat protein